MGRSATKKEKSCILLVTFIKVQVTQFHCGHIKVINWKVCVRIVENGRDILTHCGRVTQICVFNTVKLGTSASSP